jgi:multiple sugar transport system permease protein
MAKKDRAKYLFVAPGIVWVLLFTMFPLLYSLRLSFFRARLGMAQEFIWLENFGRAFTDYRFWAVLQVTVFFVVCDVALTVVLGLGLALLFHRPLRGQRVFRSIFTMPIFTAPIALGYLGLTIFHQEVGAVNTYRPWGVHLLAWFSRLAGKWLASPWWTSGSDPFVSWSSWLPQSLLTKC